MHFLFHLIFGAAKAVFFALPGIVAFLIAAASLAVFYMEELQTKLKDQRLIRWVAAIVLLLIGVGAFAADKMQKTQERGEREQAIKDTATEVAAETSKQVTKAVTEQFLQSVSSMQFRLDRINYYVTHPPPNTDCRHLQAMVSSLAGPVSQPVSVGLLRRTIESTAKETRDTASQLYSEKHGLEEPAFSYAASEELKARVKAENRVKAQQIRQEYSAKWRTILADISLLREEALKRMPPNSETG
jgi:hypothetical protein